MALHSVADGVLGLDGLDSRRPREDAISPDYIARQYPPISTAHAHMDKYCTRTHAASLAGQITVRARAVTSANSWLRDPRNRSGYGVTGLLGDRDFA